MKYMLLIYNNPEYLESLPKEDLDAIFSDVNAIMDELNKSGEWIGGEGLAHPSQTKTIRVRDGVPAVTDGPFVEAKEGFGGYYVLEARDLDHALEIAKLCPAPSGGVEVRPLLEASVVAGRR
jgi:hypothetical protein